MAAERREEGRPARRIRELGSRKHSPQGERRAQQLLHRTHPLDSEELLALARLPALEVAG
jgi:hypothetical protein